MIFQDKFGKIFNQFLDDTKGNFAIMLAIILFTLVLGVGAALDISRMIGAHAKLQDLSDATALALIQNPNLTTANGTENFTALIQEQLEGNSLYSNLDVDLDVEKKRARTALNVTTTSQLNLFFQGLWGQRQSIAVKSEIELGTQHLEVALVLDISSSMNDDRLKEMQAAARSLISTLLDKNSPNASVSISLIPFGGTVRLPDGLNNMVLGTPPTNHWADGTWNNCLFLQPSDYSNGLRSSDEFLYMPDFYTWNNGQLWCPRPGNELVAQTDDKDRLFATIDSFQRSDGTGTDIGVAWGFATLDSSWRNRFPDAKSGTPRAFTARTRKIMIVMSDGGMTGQYYPHASELAGAGSFPIKSTNEVILETQTQIGYYGICNHAKLRNIEIYTIGFLINKVGDENNLKACASDESKHFSANKGELLEIFDKIALAISPIRIAG